MTARPFRVASQASTGHTPISHSSAVVTPSAACSRFDAGSCPWACRSMNPGETTSPPASRVWRPSSFFSVDRRDAAVLDADVAHGVETGGGVDHATALDHEVEVLGGGESR